MIDCKDSSWVATDLHNKSETQRLDGTRSMIWIGDSTFRKLEVAKHTLNSQLTYKIAK